MPSLDDELNAVITTPEVAEGLSLARMAAEVESEKFRETGCVWGVHFVVQRSSGDHECKHCKKKFLEAP